MLKAITLSSLVSAVNVYRSSAVKPDESDFDPRDWKIVQKLGSIGYRLPEFVEHWQNIALAEKPFGEAQAAIDAKAEIIQPQGKNLYIIAAYNIVDDVVYVGYSESGATLELSWMEIGQFSREFRLYGTSPQ